MPMRLAIRPLSLMLSHRTIGIGIGIGCVCVCGALYIYAWLNFTELPNSKIFRVKVRVKQFGKLTWTKFIIRRHWARTLHMFDCLLVSITLVENDWINIPSLCSVKFVWIPHKYHSVSQCSAAANTSFNSNKLLGENYNTQMIIDSAFGFWQMLLDEP